MPTLKEQFRIAVDEVKKRTGLTQADIAKRLDYNRAYLSELLGKRGNVEQHHLDKIKNTTFTTPDTVVDNGGKPLPNITPKAWEDLAESVKRLSIGVETGQNNISTILGMMGTSSNSSLSIYSEDEVSEWLQRIGQGLAQDAEIGSSPGKFVAYAMKVLGDIRGLVPKDTRKSVSPAKQRTGQG